MLKEGPLVTGAGLIIIVLLIVLSGVAPPQKNPYSNTPYVLLIPHTTSETP